MLQWRGMFEWIGGSRALVEGREVCVFSSNDYLGLGREAISPRWPSLKRSTSGPGMNGPMATTESHEQLAKEIALLHRTETAILFTSCTLANHAVLTTMVSDGDLIVSDAANHASIVDGCRLSRAKVVVVAHGDLPAIEAALAQSSAARKLIVTDGVFSMEGDIVDGARLLDIADRHGALVLLDDCHAAGIVGDGSGTLFGLEVPDPVVITGSFSKALGAASGGYVAGPAKVIEALRSSRSFTFSAQIAPGAAQALREAVYTARTDPERRERLQQNADRLRRGVSELGFATGGNGTGIVPLMLGNGDGFAASFQLFAEGFFVAGFGYPVVPHGEARLRIQASSIHDQAEIDALLKALSRLRQ